MKILIIDDDKDVADSLAMVLTYSGYEVTTCYAALDSLCVARRLQPEVILHDIAMPEMSGYDSVERLRADGAFRNTLIIAITAFDSPETRRRAQAAGFDCLLTKPADLQQLRGRLPRL